jgi:chitin synthase
MALLLQAFYNAIMLAFSWFSLANFYIFFVSVHAQQHTQHILTTESGQIILTSALEDPAFGVPKISILNAVMQYVYLGTVIACFIFSMGNRPQG